MRMNNFKRSLNVTVLAVTGVLVFAGVQVDAKGKPGGGSGGGGGPTPTGEVYFRSAGGAGVMNADGSGKVAVADGEPSQVVHNGFRWHLQLQPISGQFFANGDPREEIFAVREDGAVAVQLTSDPTVQPLTFFETHPDFNWSVDQEVVDGKISFTGRQFDAAGDIIDSGIYAAQIAFEASGPVALTEVLVWFVPLKPDPVNAGLFLDEPNTEGHSWSPDGSLLVHDLRSEGELYVCDPAVNSAFLLASDGVDPEWSPDGSAIAYHGSGDVMTIAPDGTGWTLLVEGSLKGNTQKRAKDPHWSPDSSFVTYCWYVHSNGGDTMDVNVVGRDGSGMTNLTSDLQDLASPTAWR